MAQQPQGYSDLQPSIGDRLRIARERRTEMGQGEFAEHIGVSRGTVSNYERDKLPGGPRQRLVLNAWAASCDVTREWLETGNAPQPGPEGVSVERTRRDSNPKPSDPKVLPFPQRVHQAA